MLSVGGHAFDRAALQILLDDARSDLLRKAMDKMAMLPVKR